MADSDQVGLFYAFGPSVGVDPTNPVLRALRTTGPTVNLAPRTTQSNEMRPDRMLSDVPMVALDVDGAIGVEMSYGNADDWFEAGFGGAWAIKARALPTAVTATQFTLASGGTVFRQGMVVRAQGFAQAANNGLFVLAADGTGTAVTASGLAVEASPPAGASIKCVGFQGASGDMQALASPARLQITATSGNFLNLGLLPGEWVKVGGALAANNFNAAANNGWARVGSITATTITFDVAPPGWAADTGAGKAIRLSLGDRLDTGNTRRSATVQRRFTDVSPMVFENSFGQECSALEWSFQAQSIVTGTINLMGRNGVITNSQIAGATDLAAPSGDVMVTTADMGQIIVNGAFAGANQGDFIQSLTLRLDNQLRRQTGLGATGATGHGLGRINITGNASFYFASAAMAQAAINNSDNSLMWRAVAPGGGTQTYLWSLPAAKLSGSIQAQGIGQDVMLPLTITARRHPTLGHMLRMQRHDEVL